MVHYHNLALFIIFGNVYFFLGGLDGFIESLDQLCRSELNSFTDAILQLDCIACITATLNASKSALKYLSRRHKLIYQIYKCK